MRKIIVDLNVVKDNEFPMMYELFGLDVQNKSYEDFERRLLQMSIETIIEVKNRKQNLTSCAKWIFNKKVIVCIVFGVSKTCGYKYTI